VLEKDNSNQQIKAFGVEAPVLLFVGLLIGVILTYFVLANMSFFIQPLIGNAVKATVDAQKAEITSTPTPGAANSIPIEDFPGAIFDFSSDDAYGTLNVTRREDGDQDYQFHYDMPQDSEDAYAGIFFDFTPTIDLTEFKSLQIAISFGDEDAVCQVYLQDQNNGRNYVTLGINDFSAVGDAKTETEGSTRVFTIPLAENFPQTYMQSIDGIGISVNSGMVQGYHECIVHELSLLK